MGDSPEEEIIQSKGSEICDDIEDEQNSINHELLEYYKSILQKCERIYIKSVPDPILKKMSELLEYSLYDWRSLLSDLGIDDSLTLKRIATWSKNKNQPAMYIGLLEKFIPQGGNLAKVIKVLMDNRLDVLQEIRQDIIKFLAREEDECANPGLNCDDTCIENSSLQDAPCGNSEKGLNSFDAFFKPNSSMTGALRKIQILECGAYWTDSLLINRTLNPLRQNNVSVFITHSDADTQEASRLAKAFREQYGFHVRIACEVNYLLPVKGSELLSEILEEVDFIVPCVSRTYLHEITEWQDVNTETLNSLNVRYIFKLLHNEYVNRACLNYRVRPVGLGLGFNAVKSYLLLREMMPLWNYFSTVAENLIKTKQLFS